MAQKITHLQSPADSKKYGAVKSKGEPKVSASGAAPSNQKSYKYVRSSGEPKVAHAGVAPADVEKKYPAKPRLNSR